MIMTLFYVANTNPAKGYASYIAGPFRSYNEAFAAKRESYLVDDYIEVVEQTIEVE